MACRRDYILRRQNGVQLWDNSLRVLPFITIDSIADGSSWDQKIINVTYPAADTSRGETARCWTYSVNGNAEALVCSGNSATVSGFSEGTSQVTVRLVAGNNELGRASTSVEVIDSTTLGEGPYLFQAWIEGKGGFTSWWGSGGPTGDRAPYQSSNYSGTMIGGPTICHGHPTSSSPDPPGTPPAGDPKRLAYSPWINLGSLLVPPEKLGINGGTEPIPYSTPWWAGPHASYIPNGDASVCHIALFAGIEKTTTNTFPNATGGVRVGRGWMENTYPAITSPMGQHPSFDAGLTGAEFAWGNHSYGSHPNSNIWGGWWQYDVAGRQFVMEFESPFDFATRYADSGGYTCSSVWYVRFGGGLSDPNQFATILPSNSWNIGETIGFNFAGFQSMMSAFWQNCNGYTDSQYAGGGDGACGHVAVDDGRVNFKRIDIPPAGLPPIPPLYGESHYGAFPGSPNYDPSQDWYVT